MTKLLKAWAVLTPKTCDNPDALEVYGNGGRQFQYPIFETEREAKSWRDEDEQGRGRIVRVEVRVL